MINARSFTLYATPRIRRLLAAHPTGCINCLGTSHRTLNPEGCGTRRQNGDFVFGPDEAQPGVAVLPEDADDGGGDEVGHGAGEHGADAELGELVALFWGQGTDAADLDADRAEVGKAAEREGGDG